MTVKDHRPVDDGIREMFGRIAPTYESVNRFITLGRDRAWRVSAVRAAGLRKGGRVLDIGCGTGDLALEVTRRMEEVFVVAADYSREMILEGVRAKGRESFCWCLADALGLPFGDGCFDAVISGYLVRNVSDVDAALREQARVVKPGGRVVCLETCPPEGGITGLPLRLCMALLIPFIGRVAGGHTAAYRYLIESSARFMGPSGLARAMENAGLVHRSFRRFMFGTQMLHVSEKPGTE